MLTEWDWAPLVVVLVLGLRSRGEACDAAGGIRLGFSGCSHLEAQLRDPKSATYFLSPHRWRGSGDLTSLPCLSLEENFAGTCHFHMDPGYQL